ncbi:DUF6993 domain-containing protein [Micromonospora andamanensis]|uniref:DUF6993 domain-containing protein n=1 Tax=Micromonospora andamanensis TaxID=1287068 RepID=A0ABQ4I1W2_9ACTN|nr:hypothetical protein [Micromonospora andamanensis]GIJ11872.1 hypothetical protein Van01_50860 [Micromonospora andamanensis]
MRVGKISSGSAAAALTLLAFGCAAPGTRAGGPEATPTSGQPSPSVVAVPTGPQADAPPNHGDNNSWKQRRELSEADERTGKKLAVRIRPKLEALRAAGDFAPASTRRALLDLGIKADAIEVTAMRTPTGQETTPPGAVYAVHFAQVGCVIGDVRPERVMVEVTASAAEFGCLEPFSH